MADVMEQERAELTVAQATVKAQTLRIEKLEHRVARLLRVQFGRSSEKMDIAQLRLMFEEVEAPEPWHHGRRQDIREFLSLPVRVR
ncbi:transposase [Sphingobium sp. AN558]|uniref:transposase n=1 Tax=Sphingobium sp. AN558 TaxID=3133442 RepID=UPI0030C05DCD